MIFFFQKIINNINKLKDDITKKDNIIIKNNIR